MPFRLRYADSLPTTGIDRSVHLLSRIDNQRTTRKMGIVDDVRDSFERASDTDTYSVSETTHQGQTHVGTFPPETLQELIQNHSDACRAFEMITGTGYEDPSKDAGSVSQAEHSGRIEIDPRNIIDDLSNESCSCQVRLDTSNPQLVTVTDDTGTKEIEIDNAVARLTPPTGDSRGGTASLD